MDDALLGKIVIVIVLAIFIYFTCWLFIPPFADSESFIYQLFPSIYNALVMPVTIGVTCGGKTTIANKLVDTFNNISILHQDDFYYTNCLHLESIPELNYHAWDKISAYDMNKMMVAINFQTSNILVLEGILLLEDVRIVELADLKFFITIDKDKCTERRVARLYMPPEPAGYFENYAWPEYEKHLAKIKKEKGVIFLNGSDSIDFNVTIVINHINKHLSK